MGQLYCKTCKRTMSDIQFYTTKRLDKYPTGHLSECKKCITRHINNYDPSTFLWILEEIDVPYIEYEWTGLLERAVAERGADRISGISILGKYLAKMKLIQYRNYSWADSENLKIKYDEQKAQVMAAQGYSGEEIEKAITESTMPERPHLDDEPAAATPAPPIDRLEPDDFEDDLTEEDKKYLTLKWGKTYRPYEWVQLEKLYQEMMAAFDIVTPSHEDYLKLICKTSLKCHQLVDLGDIEGFQKMSKVYDTLMKSAKFTAAQNKAETGEFVSAIDEFILLCEREGFIPRYYTSEPADMVDATIADLRKYTDRLVREEMNLGNLIEGAVRTMAREEAKEEDLETTDETDIDFDAIEQEVLSDEDFTAHNDFLEKEQDADQQMMDDLLKGREK